MKRRRLGQHYLADPEVVQMMISAARILPEEVVLEIGTGKGALTRELVGLGSRLFGYEVDRENFEETLEEVGGDGATILLGDAFETKPRFDVLVSSLPYSRSAEFVDWISEVDYDRAVVLLQEDFVRKVVAGPGTRDYRAVSVIAQVSSEIQIVGKVHRSSFLPPPKVNSVVVLITPKERLTHSDIAGVKRLFSLRRREVTSALSELDMGRSTGYGRRRVYSLKPEEALEISRKQN